MKNAASFEEAVRNGIEQAAQAIIEEEAKKASVRVVERVRAMSGEICANVASYMDFQSMSDRLVITLKIEKLEKDK